MSLKRKPVPKMTVSTSRSQPSAVTIAFSPHLRDRVRCELDVRHLQRRIPVARQQDALAAHPIRRTESRLQRGSGT